MQSVIPNIPIPINRIAVIVNVGEINRTGNINAKVDNPNQFAVWLSFICMIFITANRIIKLSIDKIIPYIDILDILFWWNQLIKFPNIFEIKVTPELGFPVYSPLNIWESNTSSLTKKVIFDSKINAKHK